MSDWCLTCQFEDYDGSEEPCINCVSDTEIDGNAKPTEYFPKRPPKPITNADRIRSMTDEEMAWWFGTHACCMAEPFLCNKQGGSCKVCWLDWLKQEVGE